MLSRRQFIALGLAAVFLVGLGGSMPALRRYRRRMLKARHQPGARDPAPLDADILETLVVFTGALFGVELTVEDRANLSEGFSYAAVEDSGWRDEYRWLAGYADELARGREATGFVAADAAIRSQLIDHIMSVPIRDRRHRMIALVSEQERNRRRFRISTVGHLKRVYLFSGVPWRHRGYQSWPGVPGEWQVYTRPGPGYPS